MKYRLSDKGTHLWELLNQLEKYAKNLCLIFGKSFCNDESGCHVRFKHFPFQCACNDNEALASYIKGYCNAYEVERMEEFIAYKVSLTIMSSLLFSIPCTPCHPHHILGLGYLDECSLDGVIGVTNSQVGGQKWNSL
jgi:hypothetical protein